MTFTAQRKNVPTVNAADLESVSVLVTPAESQRQRLTRNHIQDLFTFYISIQQSVNSFDNDITDPDRKSVV